MCPQGQWEGGKNTQTKEGKTRDDPCFTKVMTPQNNRTAWFLMHDHLGQLEMWATRQTPSQCPSTQALHTLSDIDWLALSRMSLDAVQGLWLLSGKRPSAQSALLLHVARSPATPSRRMGSPRAVHWLPLVQVPRVSGKVLRACGAPAGLAPPEHPHPHPCSYPCTSASEAPVSLSAQH